MRKRIALAAVVLGALSFVIVSQTLVIGEGGQYRPEEGCTKTEMQDGYGPVWVADQDYDEVRIKAGTETYTWTNVKTGDSLEVPTGKDISHVIVCGENTPTTTTTSPTTTTEPPTTSTSVPPSSTTTTPGTTTSSTAPTTTTVPDTTTTSVPGSTTTVSSPTTTSIPTSTPTVTLPFTGLDDVSEFTVYGVLLILAGLVLLTLTSRKDY